MPDCTQWKVEAVGLLRAFLAARMAVHVAPADGACAFAFVWVIQVN